MGKPFAKPNRAATAATGGVSRAHMIRHAFLILVVLVVCAVAPVFVNHPIGYLPLVTLLFILIIDAYYLLYMKRKVEYIAEFEKKSCVRTSGVRFAVRLQNNARLLAPRIEPRFYVTDIFGELDQMIPSSTSLLGKESNDFFMTLTFGHLGSYEAGLQDMRIYDPFGLLSCMVRVEQGCTVNVEPRLVPLSRSNIDSDVFRESQHMVRALLSDDIDYAGVREYAYGDPMKSIHWKLSARSPELQTRLFETSVSPELTVLLDFHACPYSHEQLMDCQDVLVESALSLFVRAQQLRFDARIAFVGDDGEVRVCAPGSPEDCAALAMEFPLARPQVPADNIESLLGPGAAGHAIGGTMIVCAANLDVGLVSKLLAFAAGRRRVALIVAVPRAHREGFKQANLSTTLRLQAAGVAYYLVSSADELAGGDVRA